jgi:tetratricopeptide (TPR) repeat protein
MGTNNSGLSFHEHYEAWNLLLSGQKRWFFFEPQQLPPGNVFEFGLLHWLKVVAPKLEERERPFSCVQRPGELLYIPEGFFHATLNQAEMNIAVAGQLLKSRSTAYELSKRAKTAAATFQAGHQQQQSKQNMAKAFEKSVSNASTQATSGSAEQVIGALTSVQHHLQHGMVSTAQLELLWGVLTSSKSNGVVATLQARFQHDAQYGKAVSEVLLPTVQFVREAMAMAKGQPPVAIIDETGNTGQAALDLYDQALALAPGTPDFHYEKSRLLIQMSKPGQAAKEAMKSLAANPKHIDSLMMLGVSLKHTQDFKQAVMAFEVALDVDPLFAAAHYEMALCYHAMGNEETSKHHMRMGRVNDAQKNALETNVDATPVGAADEHSQLAAPVARIAEPAATLLSSLGLSQYSAKCEAEGYDLVSDLKHMSPKELVDDIGMEEDHVQRLITHLDRQEQLPVDGSRGPTPESMEGVEAIPEGWSWPGWP